MQTVNKGQLRNFGESTKKGVWIALVVGSSILFSLALACATPFPAIAAIAGMKMLRREAVILVASTWLANQAVGYLILQYPRTWESLAWGAAIGLAALLATFTVGESRSWSASTVMVAISLLVAFAVYEASLFAATAVLPSGGDAFAPTAIAYIFGINALALAGLLLFRRMAVAIGLVTAMPQASGANA